MEIITSASQLKKFTGSILIIPLLSNYKVHYLENEFSCIYIFDIDSYQEAIIGINHHDLPNNSIEIIKDINCKQIYSYKARYLGRGDVIDMELLYWYYNNEKFDDSLLYSEILSIYYRWFTSINHINNFVPIVKLYEYFRSIRVLFQYEIRNLEITDGVKFYNDVILGNLINIEKNGLYLDTAIAPKILGINSGIVYGFHYINSTTGRPSNNFNRINFLALNKTGDVRKCFISRYAGGLLLEIDFTSFHPHLISKMINYDFKDKNPYIFLAEKYFGNILIDSEMYNLSKEITFKAIYGQYVGEYSEIDFIKSIKDFTQRLWVEYKRNGYIVTPIAKRKMKREFFPEINKTTLFNYYLQATETEVMGKILHLLQTSLTEYQKIILYTYDSILIDFLPESNDFFKLDNIYNILDRLNLSYSIKVGKTYKGLHEITKYTN